MAEHDDDDGLSGGPAVEDAPFKALRALNCLDGHRLARQRHRLLPELLPWFRGDPWIERFTALIAEQRLVDIKELCESVEFHARVRRRLRAPVMADAARRPAIKKAGLLTRDARKKERKKYGQPGARKRFQYSKR